MKLLWLFSAFRTGFLWIQDLSQMDPYVILPVVNAALFLATIELGAIEGMQNQQQAGMFKNFMRFLSVAMVPLTYTLPSAVFMYWTSASFLSLGQTYVLKMPGVRKALDLPQTITPFPTSSTASSAPKPVAQPIIEPPVQAVSQKPFVPEATFAHPPKRPKKSRK